MLTKLCCLLSFATFAVPVVDAKDDQVLAKFDDNLDAGQVVHYQFVVPVVAGGQIVLTTNGLPQACKYRICIKRSVELLPATLWPGVSGKGGCDYLVQSTATRQPLWLHPGELHVQLQGIDDQCQASIEFSGQKCPAGTYGAGDQCDITPTTLPVSASPGATVAAGGQAVFKYTPPKGEGPCGVNLTLTLTGTGSCVVYVGVNSLPQPSKAKTYVFTKTFQYSAGTELDIALPAPTLGSFGNPQTLIILIVNKGSQETQIGPFTGTTTRCSHNGTAVFFGDACQHAAAKGDPQTAVQRGWFNSTTWWYNQFIISRDINDFVVAVKADAAVDITMYLKFGYPPTTTSYDIMVKSAKGREDSTAVMFNSETPMAIGDWYVAVLPTNPKAIKDMIVFWLWSGAMCPMNCNGANGKCDAISHTCDCNRGEGVACSGNSLNPSQDNEQMLIILSSVACGGLLLGFCTWWGYRRYRAYVNRSSSSDDDYLLPPSREIARDKAKMASAAKRDSTGQQERNYNTMSIGTL